MWAVLTKLRAPSPRARTRAMFRLIMLKCRH